MSAASSGSPGHYVALKYGNQCTHYLFLNPKTFYASADAERFFNLFRDEGILFSSPKTAAEELLIKIGIILIVGGEAIEFRVLEGSGVKPLPDQ